jgi:hypothetical protein
VGELGGAMVGVEYIRKLTQFSQIPGRVDFSFRSFPESTWLNVHGIAYDED